MRKRQILLIVSALLSFVGCNAQKPDIEQLNRGAIAIKTDSGVFLSWRLLATDSPETSFCIMRDGNKISSARNLKTATSFFDANGSQHSKYEIVTLDANNKSTETFTIDSVWSRPVLQIALDMPANHTTPDGRENFYMANDCSIGDVDGDGEYELIVKFDPSNSHDNSHKGYTSPVIIDCYKLNGHKLWRINLGQNIRAGAHYTQFLVYDFDGDGKAEMACKTAPGSVDGSGKYVSEAADDEQIRSTNNSACYVNKTGHVMDGPEFLTVFNGETGAAMHTVYYEPNRNVVSLDKNGWGDGYGNRSERYLACVAYLPDSHGVGHHNIVMCRGYYTYAYVCAWQFADGKLTKTWLYSTPEKDPLNTLYGQGAHSVMVADVDNDGFDEIIYGAAALDHDGTLLHSTGWGHGDALHVADIVPDRDGLEIFMPHESGRHAGLKHTANDFMAYGAELRDARTGEILWATESSDDNGRGIAADIDPNYDGMEFWSLADNYVYDAKGNIINKGVEKRPQVNFRVYWDGDLQDELFDGGIRRNKRARTEQRNDTTKQQRPLFPLFDGGPGAMYAKGASCVYKWNSATKQSEVLQKLDGFTCNGTKNTPNFLGDIFGDWREEIVLNFGPSLYIYTTTIPTEYRVVTLTHDHQYRMSLASQNVSYNQPPHLSYALYNLFKINNKTQK
ncbi:MAG: rhamnogalacturonan lyase [Marinilabiliaceae bacterium]|nr:rhamnogalacturonan lyase [Marinilabiliaceae bacterium]